MPRLKPDTILSRPDIAVSTKLKALSPAEGRGGYSESTELLSFCSSRSEDCRPSFAKPTAGRRKRIDQYQTDWAGDGFIREPIRPSSARLLRKLSRARRLAGCSIRLRRTQLRKESAQICPSASSGLEPVETAQSVDEIAITLRTTKRLQGAAQMAASARLRFGSVETATASEVLSDTLGLTPGLSSLTPPALPDRAAAEWIGGWGQ